MSVFTSSVTLELHPPADPSQSITIRKLAPKHLKAAAKAHLRQSMAEFKELDADLMKQVSALVNASDKSAETAKALQEAKAADPLASYDAVELMLKGVTDWTLGRERDREAFEDLDEDTSDWLARAILKLAKPSLFQTVEEQTAAQKNG